MSADDDAASGETTLYVPCRELAASLPATDDDEQAVSGHDGAFVPLRSGASASPPLDDDEDAITGRSVGYVAAPCEECGFIDRFDDRTVDPAYTPPLDPLAFGGPGGSPDFSIGNADTGQEWFDCWEQYAPVSSSPTAAYQSPPGVTVSGGSLRMPLAGMTLVTVAPGGPSDPGQGGSDQLNAQNRTRDADIELPCEMYAEIATDTGLMGTQLHGEPQTNDTIQSEIVDVISIFAGTTAAFGVTYDLVTIGATTDRAWHVFSGTGAAPRFFFTPSLHFYARVRWEDRGGGTAFQYIRVWNEGDAEPSTWAGPFIVGFIPSSDPDGFDISVFAARAAQADATAPGQIANLPQGIVAAATIVEVRYLELCSRPIATP